MDTGEGWAWIMAGVPAVFIATVLGTKGCDAGVPPSPCVCEDGVEGPPGPPGPPGERGVPGVPGPAGASWPYEVVLRGPASVDVPPNTSRAVTMACDEGEILLSGGCTWSDENSTVLPTTSRWTQQGWLCRGTWNGGTTSRIEAWAVCAGEAE